MTQASVSGGEFVRQTLVWSLSSWKKPTCESRASPEQTVGVVSENRDRDKG